jgi:hypothetical protein
MDETHETLMQLLLGLRYRHDVSARENAAFKHRRLVCTPFAANYGDVSGWIVCVEGTPPKATLLLYGAGKMMICINGSGSRTKKIFGEHQRQIVEAFYAKHLARSEIRVVLDPCATATA